MWPDRVSNPGPLTYESGALPIALRGPAERERERERERKSERERRSGWFIDTVSVKIIQQHHLMARSFRPRLGKKHLTPNRHRHVLVNKVGGPSGLVLIRYRSNFVYCRLNVLLILD